MLIRTAEGYNILLDAGLGPRKLGGNLVQDRLIPFFRQNGIRRLDAFIISHPHTDHVGDPEALSRNVHISRILTNADGAYYFRKKKYGLFRASGRVLPIDVLSRGDKLRFGSLLLEVLNPPRRISPPWIVSSNIVLVNHRSLVIRVTYGNVRFLFSGDLGYHGEWTMLLDRMVVRADVLKLGHHGVGSTSRRWLNAVRPRFAVASCCSPHGRQRLGQALLDRLADAGTILFQTHTYRDIEFTTDGWRLEVTTHMVLMGLLHKLWRARHYNRMKWVEAFCRRPDVFPLVGHRKECKLFTLKPTTRSALKI